MENLSIRTAHFLRRIGATLLTARARLLGHGFVCDSLQGTARSGICITSDLMLSCGYRDLDGSGQVGNVRERAIEDVFFGSTAQSFRRQLAAGRIPTPNCTRCVYLRKVPKREALRQLGQITTPTSVMLENTSACNLHCVCCRRDTVARLRKRRTMSLDDVRKIAGDMQRIGIEEITFHHLGEPFLSTRLRDELTVILDRIPHVKLQVSTNGMLIDTDEKREAALLFDHVEFSLDGVEQSMAARYQRGLDFGRVLRNLRNLVEYRDIRGSSRPRIVWKYLLFRWNERREHVLAAIKLARESGADEIRFEKTVSPLYGLPWRSHLGLNRDLGGDCSGLRQVLLRETPAGS